ncbi:MAG TPA: hypothetical protein PL048_24170, partial [Leptospiraceae bacterium]|nr:hypothetical protein [Leptospiraceae bacterium]
MKLLMNFRQINKSVLQRGFIGQEAGRVTGISSLKRMAVCFLILFSFSSCFKKALFDNPFYGIMGIYYSIFQTPDKEIGYYSFERANNPGLVRNISSDILGKRVRMYVPYGTQLESMVATYEYKAKQVDIGEAAQISGKTSNDFRKDVIYRVTANDDTKTDYTVIIDKGSIDSKRMKTFGFLQKQNNIVRDSYGIFIGYTINVILPYGASLNPLIAKFTSDGSDITVNGLTQNSESTSNDFEKPITYRVHAADGSYQDYPVSAAVASKDSKEILYFVFTQDANFGNLNGDFFTTIVGNSISVTLPTNT